MILNIFVFRYGLESGVICEGDHALVIRIDLRDLRCMIRCSDRNEECLQPEDLFNGQCHGHILGFGGG